MHPHSLRLPLLLSAIGQPPSPPSPPIAAFPPHLHALQAVHARDTVAHGQYAPQVRDGGLVLLLKLLHRRDELGADVLDQVLAAELGLECLRRELAGASGQGGHGPAGEDGESEGGRVSRGAACNW